MAGRRFKLWLCGGVLFGGTAGCHRQQTQPGGAQMPPSIAPAGTKSASWFSFWKPSPPSTPASTAVSGPVEISTAPKTPSGKPKEWSADAIVAFADVRAGLALAPERAGGDRAQLADQARLGYQKALQKDPKNKGGLLGMAKLYAGVGEKAKAEEMYRRYVKLYPKDHSVVFEVAMANARWKNWPGAVGWCQQALTVDPENREYRRTLGFFLAHAGEWEKGFAVLCQVMPEAQARYNMAKALDQNGLPEICRQQLLMALQADPAFTPAREMLAQLQADQQPPVPGAGTPTPAIQTVGYQQPARPGQ